MAAPPPVAPKKKKGGDDGVWGQQCCVCCAAASTVAAACAAPLTRSARLAGIRGDMKHSGQDLDAARRRAVAFEYLTHLEEARK
jgi:hypothetical protein